MTRWHRHFLAFTSSKTRFTTFDEWTKQNPEWALAFSTRIEIVYPTASVSNKPTLHCN